MLEVTPKDISEHIVTSFDVRSCQKLVVCIENTLRALIPEMNKNEVYEVAEKIRGKVSRHLSSYMQEYNDRGIPPRISWSSLDNSRLVGCSFIRSNERTNEAQYKKRLECLPLIWHSISKKIEPSHFEKLSLKFLSSHGFRNIIIENRSHDGGIDFSAEYVRLPQIYGGMRLSSVGQVKRYNINHKVDVNEIRAFNTSVDVRELKEGRKIGLKFFFTSSNFTKEANKICSLLNIKALDGEQMAHWIVTIGTGFNESLEFDEELFLHFVSVT